MTWRMMLVIALTTLAVGTHSQAQDKSPWVGKKVVTRYAKPLKVLDGTVDDGKIFRVYSVERVNGDWLWLVSGSVEGWVVTGDVVPFDQGIDFYTQEIRANPKNSSAYNWRGLFWSEKEEHNIAVADYNEAIRLDPKYAAAFYNRGNAWYDKKEYDKAIAD